MADSTNAMMVMMVIKVIMRIIMMVRVKSKRQPKPPVGAQLIVILGEFLFSHCEARCPVCLAPVGGGPCLESLLHLV